MSRPVAIVAGYLARYPLGGHLLSQYHFLAGLAKLGYEVVFVEHHGWSNACYDPRTNTMSDDPMYGLSQILPFFKSIGSHRWCYVDAAGKWHGLQRDDVSNLCRNAAFVASVSSTTWLDELRECPTRIFVDIDPASRSSRCPRRQTPPVPATPRRTISIFTSRLANASANRIARSRRMGCAGADSPAPREGVDSTAILAASQTFHDHDGLDRVWQRGVPGVTYGQKDLEISTF